MMMMMFVVAAGEDGGHSHGSLGQRPLPFVGVLMSPQRLGAIKSPLAEIACENSWATTPRRRRRQLIVAIIITVSGGFIRAAAATAVVHAQRQVEVKLVNTGSRFHECHSYSHYKDLILLLLLL